MVPNRWIWRRFSWRTPRRFRFCWSGSRRRGRCGEDAGPRPPSRPSISPSTTDPIPPRRRSYWTRCADTGAHATFFPDRCHISRAGARRRSSAACSTKGDAVALHSETRALMIKTPAALARNAHAATPIASNSWRGPRPCRGVCPHAGWRGGADVQRSSKHIDHKLVGWSWGLWDFNWYRPREARSPGRKARPTACRQATSSSCTTAIMSTRERSGDMLSKRHDSWFRF